MLRWLEAGATGSYGTVQEPCKFPQKFPDPVIVVDTYLRGETLIETYWKSVAMPGQGIFIGKPQWSTRIAQSSIIQILPSHLLRRNLQ